MLIGRISGDRSGYLLSGKRGGGDRRDHPGISVSIINLIISALSRSSHLPRARSRSLSLPALCLSNIPVIHFPASSISVCVLVYYCLHTLICRLILVPYTSLLALKNRCSVHRILYLRYFDHKYLLISKSDKVL